MVFKKITLIGRSNESFEAATTDAIDRAEETLDHLQWATVTDESVELAGSEREFQVEIEAAFELQEGTSE